MDIYEREIVPGAAPVPVEIVETDIDLYYHIALALYLEIEKNNAAGKNSVFILPVGPVYQYRRFVWLCRLRPLDLSRVYCFLRMSISMIRADGSPGIIPSPFVVSSSGSCSILCRRR